MEQKKHLKEEIEKDSSLKESLIINAHTPPTLLAWSSSEDNKISVINFQTKENVANFHGAMISDSGNSWTLVREIPNTRLIVSLHHNHNSANEFSAQYSANMEIFEISKKGQANKVYSLGEVKGVTGWGDVTYNARRGILGVIPITGRIAYHLFKIDTNTSNAKDLVRLTRKSKWHLKFCRTDNNWMCGFDFNLAGESIATIDSDGVCLISDVNTSNYGFHLDLDEDYYSRCRWSTNPGESLLFVKHGNRKLNILDAEKKALTLKKPIILGDWDTCWIDVCQNNGNLLAADGSDRAIKIFDKRESRIVKSFKEIHSDTIRCVRWSPNGDMLVTASDDGRAKLLDFRAGKVLHKGKTSDKNAAKSVCFI